VLLDCVIYCAFYSILFRGAVFSGHGVYIAEKFIYNSVNDITGLPLLV